MAHSSPLQFNIQGISLDDTGAITRAVRTIDSKASVSVDAESGLVVIGGQGETPDFVKAIEDAGFKVKAAG